MGGWWALWRGGFGGRVVGSWGGGGNGCAGLSEEVTVASSFPKHFYDESILVILSKKSTWMGFRPSVCIEGRAFRRVACTDMGLH